MLDGPPQTAVAQDGLGVATVRSRGDDGIEGLLILFAGHGSEREGHRAHVEREEASPLLRDVEVVALGARTRDDADLGVGQPDAAVALLEQRTLASPLGRKIFVLHADRRVGMIADRVASATSWVANNK